MTHKYIEVRRAMYEKNPASKISSYRSFSGMAKLFKRSYWIMLAAFLIAIISFIFFVITSPENPILWFIIIAMFIILLLSQILREKYLFNDSERQKELLEMQEQYAEYISEIRIILKNHGVSTPEKVLLLKHECETSLKIRDDKYNKISGKVFEMFIGIPLGALIACIIKTNNDIVPIAIGSIIFIGITISGAIKLFQSVSYYSDGYFKDKYLLDTLNELDYSEYA